MRQNEDALIGIRKKKENLERQEDELYTIKVQSHRYIEEQREIYAGTHEFDRINRLDDNIHELTEISRKLLDKEYEELEKEEKRLYTQQEKHYEEYQSELRAYYNKEDN